MIDTIRLGLGIDAGGTYTDVVLFDFQRQCVLQKAKAPTTKWDFTVGIGEALDRLDREPLRRVQLVAISTTLATNAIVEGRGQRVGLLILPPYGLYRPDEIAHQPLAVLDGQLEIDGRELRPIDQSQVRAVVRELVRNEHVGAFAVSGYASHANPAHELAVQAIVRAETGLAVTCGHEVSDKPNYRVRSITAALNASIIPCLEAFLDSVDASLRARGVCAVRMVVRSDGSLMSLPFARQQPITTLLSGPAASVAGAVHLAGKPDAIVVDMGGTTTDTAILRGGLVRTSREGASVGPWRTHVGALELRTVGLGGDSLIAQSPDDGTEPAGQDRLCGMTGTLRIGPRRVTPLAWTFRHGGDGGEAIDWIEAHIGRFRGSTDGATLIVRTQGQSLDGLNETECRILDAVRLRPRCLDELALHLDARRWQFLPLERLEHRHLVECSGLTPTDLLHSAGRLDFWNVQAARRVGDLFARLLHIGREELERRVQQGIVRRLATELLKTQLALRGRDEGLDASGAAWALLENWLSGGDAGHRVRVALRSPIVGIGAPIHFYLPEVARLLETEAVHPRDADVANAVGAITSQVVVQKKFEIAPSDGGRFRLDGLPGAPSFPDLEQAHEAASRELVKLVQRLAWDAGTAETAVDLTFRDHTAPAADGTPIFLGRELCARLAGPPDLNRLGRGVAIAE